MFEIVLLLLIQYVFCFLFIFNKRTSFLNICNIIPIGVTRKKNIIKRNIGEIIYKGDQVSNGYLNDKLKTNLKFVKFSWDETKETWYKSGDLGFINNDGDLEYVGRIDSQIKIGGKRIEIGEIEAAFNKYHKTKGIVIVAVKNKQNIVENLIAFTINKLENSEEKNIKNDITQHIEKIFIPKKIIFIENFPLTISGKIDRKELEKNAKHH